jgi:hypothetical protein
MKRNLLLTALFLSLAVAGRSRAASPYIGVQPVVVLAPHLAGSTHPMDLAYAQSSWNYVRNRYWTDSYQQYDLPPTFLPPYEVPLDPTKAVGAAQCPGYSLRAVNQALALGYDIPPGAFIAVIQHDCMHAGGVNYLVNPDRTLRNVILYGEKPMEMLIVLGYRTGIWNPYAFYCNSLGCDLRFTDVIDVVGVDVPSGYQRFARGWLTNAAGDVAYAQVDENYEPIAGQFILHPVESPRDGQPKLLRAGPWVVEMRKLGPNSPPLVTVGLGAYKYDLTAACPGAQWALPVGSVFRLPDIGWQKSLGIRTDALTASAATVSVLENVTASAVAATQCVKARWTETTTTTPPPTK